MNTDVEASLWILSGILQIDRVLSHKMDKKRETGERSSSKGETDRKTDGQTRDMKLKTHSEMTSREEK